MCIRDRRTPEDVYFHQEFLELSDGSFAIDLVYTRRAPAGWQDPVGRLTESTIAARTLPPEDRPRIFVCGSTGFVEAVAPWLVKLGHAPQDILTERFGGL